MDNLQMKYAYIKNQRLMNLSKILLNKSALYYKKKERKNKEKKKKKKKKIFISYRICYIL